MNFTLEQLMSILGTLATIAIFVITQAWLTIRYLLGKQETSETRQAAALQIQITAREAAIAELHRRLDTCTDEAARFREHVAKTYATTEFLRDVEARIMAGLGATEGRLTQHLAKLEERIERHGRAGPAE